MAFNLNGSSQFLSAGSAVVTGPPATMGGFFKPTNITTAGVLVGVMEGGSTNNELYILIAGTFGGDPIQAASKDTTTSGAVSTAGFIAGEWQHAVARFSSTTSRDAYLNGGNKGSNTATSSPVNIDSTHIGSLNRPTDIFFFDGDVAEVFIYNVALTDAEIAWLGKGYSPLTLTHRIKNLVLYKDLIRAIDRPNFGPTLTNNNGATVATHAPVIYPSIPIIGIPSVAGTLISPALDTIAITGQAVTLQDDKNLAIDSSTIVIAGFDVTVASTKNIIPATGIINITGQDVSIAVGVGNQALIDLWMIYLAGQGFTQDAFNSRLKAGFVSNASIIAEVGLADAIHTYFNQQGIPIGATQDRMLVFLDTNYPTLTGSLTDKLFATLQNNEFFV